MALLDTDFDLDSLISPKKNEQLIVAKEWFPSINPGNTKTLVKESEACHKQITDMYQGLLVAYRRKYSHTLFETKIRAGMPGTEAFVSANIMCFSDKLKVKAEYINAIGLVTTKARYSPYKNLILSAKAKVEKDLTEHFIDELGIEYRGVNFTLESRYLQNQHKEEIISASYTQAITTRLSTGTTILYSINDKIPMLSFAGRYEYNTIALYASALLPKIPGTKIFIPNRILTGFSLRLDDYQKVATEFQLNPSETQIFDSIAKLYYEAQLRGACIRLSLDSSLRMGILYEERQKSSSLGAASFSGFVDYLSKDYKFGFGTTISF